MPPEFYIPVCRVALVNLLSQVLAADLDRDGDMDLISVSRDLGRIMWHENLLIDATTAPSAAPIITGSPLVPVTDSPAATSTSSPVSPGTTSPEASDDASSLEPSAAGGKKHAVLVHEIAVDVHTHPRVLSGTPAQEGGRE